MQCKSPRTVGFQADGKTLAWSQKKHSKEYATFQLPCGKCLGCRLEYARNWAVRCVHESLIHENNIFITLTYSDEHLKSPRLDYSDFQNFMKCLRSKRFDDTLKTLYGTNSTQKERRNRFKNENKDYRKDILDEIAIGVFVTGEYGDLNKRPHWHACIFNYAPSDQRLRRTTEVGDKVYESDELSTLWGKGTVEFGSVTFESAGYCARYAAKKLSHGKDDEHDFHPISKKSSRYAIGRRYLEKYWSDIFNHGKVVLPNGSISGIPRYYEKWLQKHKPEQWLCYIDKVKLEKQAQAEIKAKKESLEELTIHYRRFDEGKRKIAWSRRKVKHKILEAKFKKLQEYKKL